MINYVRYVYNLDINKIEKINNNYLICTDSTHLYLVEVVNHDWINYMNILNQSLNTYYFFSYKFLRNVYGDIITKVGDKNYVLMDVMNDYNTSIDLMENLDFYRVSNNYLKSNNYRYVNNWISLWESKIDYLKAFSNKNNVSDIRIQPFFYYYVGLCSSLINYLKKTDSMYGYSIKDQISLCHRRIDIPITKLQFFNSVDYRVDLSVRDIGEYISSLYYDGSDFVNELNYYLKVNNLTPYSAAHLFARIIYPSIFLDYYENKSKTLFSEKLFDIDSYEKFMKKTYEIINSYVNIPIIEWLKV